MAKVIITLEDEGNLGININTEYEPAFGKEVSFAQTLAAVIVERISDGIQELNLGTISESNTYDSDN